MPANQVAEQVPELPPTEYLQLLHEQLTIAKGFINDVIQLAHNAVQKQPAPDVHVIIRGLEEEMRGGMRMVMRACLQKANTLEPHGRKYMASAEQQIPTNDTISNSLYTNIRSGFPKELAQENDGIIRDIAAKLAPTFRSIMIWRAIINQLIKDAASAFTLNPSPPGSVPVSPPKPQ